MPDLDVSTMRGRSFDAVCGIMLCRRHPLFHTLEVDLNGVDGAAGDGCRLGARHVVELCWLHNERWRPVDSVVVHFLWRPRRARLSQIFACTNVTAIRCKTFTAHVAASPHRRSDNIHFHAVSSVTVHLTVPID